MLITLFHAALVVLALTGLYTAAFPPANAQGEDKS